MARKGGGKAAGKAPHLGLRGYQYRRRVTLARRFGGIAATRATTTFEQTVSDRATIPYCLPEASRRSSGTIKTSCAY